MIASIAWRAQMKRQERFSNAGGPWKARCAADGFGFGAMARRASAAQAVRACELVGYDVAHCGIDVFDLAQREVVVSTVMWSDGMLSRAVLNGEACYKCLLNVVGLCVRI